MIADLILLTVAAVALIIASITDIKTREVPDWLNFSLIFIGLGVRLIYSSLTFDWIYSLEGLLGLVAFVIIGYIMFYAGQWGGGDSKLLMGLGALIGLRLTFYPLPLILILLINIMFIGAIYGLFYTIAKAITHRKAFAEEFKKHIGKRLKLHKYLAIVLIALIIIFFAVFGTVLKGWFISIMLILLTLLLYSSVYVYYFVKSVEKVAMLKLVDPKELTEGDWIAKPIVINKKKIAGPKDLGISKKQIKELIAYKKKGKIKQVLIKIGIPFVPSFLVAFIITVIFGAWWIFLF
ncbi:A24 family peptidase [Candidatus Woesearchaeota archaeon]|nr:A24 family peptidase [Candidatus Woesearchaeota archaeon]